MPIEFNGGAHFNPREILPLEIRGASEAMYVLKDATFRLELPNKFTFTPSADSDKVRVMVMPIPRKGDRLKYDIDIIIFDKTSVRAAYNLEDFTVEAVQVTAIDTPPIEARVLNPWRQRLGPFSLNATYIFHFPDGGNIKAYEEPSYPPDMRLPSEYRPEGELLRIASSIDNGAAAEEELLLSV